jgi:hypothetical protein
MDSNKIIWQLNEYNKHLLTDTDIQLHKKYVNVLSEYHTTVEKFVLLRKPTFFYTLCRVFRNIFGAFFLFKKYTYFKNILADKYNQEKNKILTIDQNTAVITEVYDK